MSRFSCARWRGPVGSGGVLLAVAICAACAGGGRQPPAPRLWPQLQYPALAGPVFAEVPWLSDASTWVGEGCGELQPKDPGHMGDFGVGNGRVFSLGGYACPLNLLHTMAGPDYQQEESFYQDTWFELESGGQALAVSRALAYRPRRTAMLVVTEEAGDLYWHSLTFAPLAGGGPEERALVRLIEINNRSSAASPDLVLVTSEADSEREGRMRRLGCLQPSGCADPARLELGVLQPGEWKRVVLAYLTGRAEGECSETLSALQGKEIAALLQTTRDRWEEFISGAARLESPDVRVDDLLEGVLTTVRAQQTYLGGISPMSRYSLMWIRDTAGTVRFLLSVSLYEEVRRLIEYYHLAAAARGDISNAVDLDVPEDPPPAEPDWDNLGPFSGRQAAEGPSYIPLMIHWYVRASGDASLATGLYPMLRRCLLAQTIDDSDLLTFSGDETFRAALSMSLGLAIEYDYPACCRSANSSFLFAAAAEALAGYAGPAGRAADEQLLLDLAGRVRQAAGATYLRPEGTVASFVDLGQPGYLPPPFEDVATQPLWTGYSTSADEAARLNLAGCVELLDRGDGFLQSPLHPDYQGYMGLEVYEGVHTGMAPGYYLYDLAAADHPRLERAFNALGTAASPSGNYSEYHIYDDHSVLQPIYEGSGTLGDMTARYRHWEGSIDMEALVFALTGLEADGAAGEVGLAPRLPNDWPRMKWTGLRCGDVRFDLLVEELGGRRRATVSPQEGMLSVRLSVPLIASKILKVQVNGERLDPQRYRIISWFEQPRVELDAYPASASEPLLVEVDFE